MDVVVIGAGVAGSLAGRALAEAGHEVRVLDKGFAPGGRLAARTVDGATFDVGAQFLTARSDRFQRLVAGWESAGVVAPWFRGSPDREAPAEPDGHPRWRGTPTMRTLAAHLLAPLTSELGTVVTRLTPREHRWEVELASRESGAPSRPDAVPADAPRRRIETEALVLTAPLPQTHELLRSSGVPLADLPALDALGAHGYEPCLTLLARPRGRVDLPPRGAVRIEDGTLAWISDHHVTGASPVPAVTVHGAAAFSRDHLDADHDVAAGRLTRAAEAVVGCRLEPLHLQRWRYATPTGIVGDASLVTEVDGAPLAVAGDAFLGGRIEGAALSGLDAADRLDRLARKHGTDGTAGT